MINLITLENFRCFQREQVAHLAPLTLLVGENSTGKSSFLSIARSLAGLATDAQIPDFKEEPFDLGSFDEIVFNGGTRNSKPNWFKAGCRIKLPQVRRSTENSSATTFDFKFQSLGTAPYPVRRRIFDGEFWIEDEFDRGYRTSIELGSPRGVWRRTFEPSGIDRFEREFDRLPSAFGILRTFDHLPDDPPEVLYKPVGESPSFEYKDEDRQRWLRLGYRRIRSTTHSSAPVRSRPRRTYDPARPTPDPEGDYIPMLLAEYYLQNRKVWTRLKADLEQFGRQSGLFDEISIRELGKTGSEPFQIQVRKSASKRRKGPRRNLSDVGYGVSQVLPIVTELLRSSGASLYLLQQPEVHLHPSAQAALGDLFCSVARSRRQLIVETHSDYLIDRVRMSIRDRSSRLRPRDLSILFFERTGLDVQIHSLRVDKEGNIQNAPPGYRRFFMEETQRSLGL